MGGIASFSPDVCGKVLVDAGERHLGESNPLSLLIWGTLEDPAGKSWTILQFWTELEPGVDVYCNVLIGLLSFIFLHFF